MEGLGNKKIFSNNLRFLMERFGKDRNQICNDLNFKYTTFADWYNGNKYPRIDKIEMLANYFGVLKSDLIEDKGGRLSIDSPQSLPSNVVPVDFPHLKRIPILGRIPAGYPMLAEENIEGYTYTDLNGGADYFALRVKGDSMDAAGIKNGYIVIVRKQEIVLDGEIAVVLIDMEDATLKRFYRDGDIVTLMPQSTNPKHKPQIYQLSDTNISVLGKVVKVEFVP
ncbi:hypothetical protein NE562_17480 [Butyricicoccus faecihominis]|uniref:LexA family protein n=1 Tax=Butyricicoccus faecihominis TaxID=1712515 RepID=UPI00247A13FA|nr:S24 family peptidase [Butyricicoccus faecihominis]MCQ5131447.1 hypothetical protein [Butyricicoccus faecihominis]